MKLLCSLNRPWLIKLCLVIIFVANTGVIGLMIHVSQNASPDPTSSLEPVEIARRSRQLQSLIIKLTAAAKAKQASGNLYSPADYGRDLEQIYQKEAELELEGLAFFPIITNLASVSTGSGQFTVAEIQKVQESLQEKYLRNHLPKNDDPKPTLSEIGFWFLKQYLLHMPLALVLICLWLRKEREDETGKGLPFPKTFRLGLILLIYPVVLFIVFRKWWRETGGRIRTEAEYRRYQRKLFAFLSPEEKRQIEEFSESQLPIAEMRRHFINLGLKPQHCLLAALMTAFVFSALSKTADEKQNLVDSALKASPIHYCCLAQHLPRGNICVEKMQPAKKWDGQTSGDDLISKVFTFEIVAAIFPALLRELLFPITEYISGIDHVPISVASSGLSF